MYETLLLLFAITSVFEMVNLSFRQERGYLFFYVVLAAAGLYYFHPAAASFDSVKSKWSNS